MLNQLLYRYMLMIPTEEWTPFLLKRIGPRKPRIRLPHAVTRVEKKGSATVHKRVLKGA